MTAFWRALALLALLSSSPAHAQSSIDNLFPVPAFPYPDPATVPPGENLWMTQGGIDYRTSITQLGAILQTNCATIIGPFSNQLCWDTTTTPATLKVYQGGTWTAVVPSGQLAPINSPHFTGIPTAPTAPLGTSTDQIATTAFVAASQKVKLATTQILYVSPSGIDANNNCTVQTAPCGSIQNAVNQAYNSYDLNGSQMLIQLVGTTPAVFGAGVNISGALAGQLGAAGLTIQGDVNNPDNYVISCAGTCFVARFGARYQLQGVKITSTSGDCIWAHDFGEIVVNGVDFGAAALDHVRTSEFGTFRAIGDYVISGSAQRHWQADRYGAVFGWNVDGFQAPVPVTINLVGTPAFLTFAAAHKIGLIDAANDIFTGSGATGTRFLVDSQAQIQTGGGGANFLPGNVAGTADGASFGLYQ